MLHTLNLQDVAVPADENVRRILRQRPPHIALPPPGSAGDMSHPEPKPFNIKSLMLRSAQPKRLAVYVSIDGLDRRQLLQCIQHILRPDITCMKNQIDAGKFLCDCRMQITVRVR